MIMAAKTLRITDKPTSKRGQQPNEAVKAKADEADATNEADASSMAININAVDEVDKAYLTGKIIEAN